MRLLAGLLYSGSGPGLVAGLPGAGDKPLASPSLRPRYIGLGELFTDFSIDVLSREIRAWIPACAGMTIVGGWNHHFRTHDEAGAPE